MGEFFDQMGEPVECRRLNPACPPCDSGRSPDSSPGSDPIRGTRARTKWDTPVLS